MTVTSLVGWEVVGYSRILLEIPITSDLFIWQDQPETSLQEVFKFLPSVVTQVHLLKPKFMPGC